MRLLYRLFHLQRALHRRVTIAIVLVCEGDRQAQSKNLSFECVR